MTLIGLAFSEESCAYRRECVCSRKETSGHPAGSVQYGAFAPGHEGDWTSGETAAASMPETKFKVRKTATELRCRSLVKRANGDGSVSYVATMGRGSMQMVIR